MRQPNLSQRARSTAPSPIRKLVPLAEEAKAQGVKVYHLNIGQPDIESPPEALAAIRRWDGRVLAYGFSEGEPELREEIARYYTRVLDRSVESQHIFITTAGSEAIVFAMTAVADPGDEIIVFEPFYTNYRGFATMASVRLVPITLSVERGFHLPPEEVIESKITERTRAILVCSPNNPTGTVYTREEMEMVARVARRHGLFVLSDEVYREFAYEGPATSILQLEGTEDFGVVMDSVSKRFSMCGARIGNILTFNRELWSTLLRFGQARLCPPYLEQVAALWAYRTLEHYMGPVVEEYRRRRDVVYRALNRMEGVNTFLPEGAFYTVAKLPVRSAEDFAAWLLSEFWRKEGLRETLMVAPASGFYATPGAGADEIRIAFVLKEEDLARAMELLARALEVYPDRV